MSVRAHNCTFEGCDKSFKMAQHLTYHKTTHEEKIVDEKLLCPYESCNKRFRSEWILRDHINTHKNEYKFHCAFDENCDKKYNTRSNLEVHLRKHLDVKPFSCNTCYRRFISKWNLDKHIKWGQCKDNQEYKSIAVKEEINAIKGEKKI